MHFTHSSSVKCSVDATHCLQSSYLECLINSLFLPVLAVQSQSIASYLDNVANKRAVSRCIEQQTPAACPCIYFVQVGLNGLFSKYGTVERLSVREKEFCQTAYVMGRSRTLEEGGCTHKMFYMLYKYTWPCTAIWGGITTVSSIGGI